MRIRRVQRAAVFAAGFAMAVGGTALASAATAQPAQVRGGQQPSGIQHVLLISVDGLHQQDLTWYVNNFPDSTLASLDHQGLEYSNAMTPFPSDSFPGMVGQVTGGNPKTTGIYYDDTWNHDVFPIGTTNCSGPVPGAEVAYTEANDINLNSIDAGQGLRGLPGSILRMTPNPRRVINPANLPVDPRTCQPIYPNQYLKVNTIFNLVKHYLLTHSAAGNNISGNPITVSSSGLKAVYAGAASAAFFGVPKSDPRHPDVLGIVQHGVVYTGGMSKIAEHGGDDPQDRNVPILVVLPNMRHGHTVGTPVETTQIAPSILSLLGLNPGQLQAVRIEHTAVLPGLN